MSKELYGSVISGSEAGVRPAYDRWRAQPVDQEMTGPDDGIHNDHRTSLAQPASVTGSGTFFGRAQRTLSFLPAAPGSGWRLDRHDLTDSLPIAVSVENVWTTVRNIVLRSGSPHNYMRMVEHIIALKVGMGLDDVLIRVNSGDPPLFERSSMDLVEAIESAGLVAGSEPASYVTVKEPVTVAGNNGSFLTFLPAEINSRQVEVDCAIDFANAIGQQRIRFTVSRESFRLGAAARTNTTFWMMVYTRTIGKIFADVRNLGYTTDNILVAGKRRYANEPHLVTNGKSLEAVWHRATLDLLAAVALISPSRFAGRIISYRAGHALDCLMITKLYQHNLLTPM